MLRGRVKILKFYSKSKSGLRKLFLPVYKSEDGSSPEECLGEHLWQFRDYSSPIYTPEGALGI